MRLALWNGPGDSWSAEKGMATNRSHLRQNSLSGTVRRLLCFKEKFAKWKSLKILSDVVLTILSLTVVTASVWRSNALKNWCVFVKFCPSACHRVERLVNQACNSRLEGYERRNCSLTLNKRLVQRLSHVMSCSVNPGENVICEKECVNGEKDRRQL